MNSRDNLEFREFDFADIGLTRKAIDLLNSNSSARKHDIEFWNWRFIKNPFGPSRGWYAVDKTNGNLAGILMWWPWKFTSPDGEFIAYQAINGITAEDYRNMGIFLNFNKLAIRYFEENNYLLIGFPNEGSYPSYRKLQWDTVGRVHLYVTPILGIKLLLSLFRKRNGADLIPAEFDVDSNEIKVVQSGDSIRTMWDENSIDWRFSRHPGRKYYLFKSDQGELIFRIRKHGRLNEAQIVFTNTRGKRLFSKFRRFISGYDIAVITYYGSGTAFLKQVTSSLLTFRHFKKVWFVADRKPDPSGDYHFAVEFCDMDTT